MARLGDVAKVVVKGMPEGDDTKSHAWLIHRQVLTWALDQERKGDANESLGIDGWRLAGRRVEIDGIPGILWLGQLKSARVPLGMHVKLPYGTPFGASEELKALAKSNWQNLHGYLTRDTANLICIERHAGDVPSVYWVRLNYSDSRVTQNEYERLRAIAKGEEAPEKLVALPAGDPVPVPDAAPAKPPASHEMITDKWECRYRLATGCQAVYGSKMGLYQHTELASAHSDHRIDLTTCPLCDDPKVDSTIKRSKHLSYVHGCPADSVERSEYDALQTQALWQDREEARLRQPAPVAAPEPADDITDDVVRAAISGLGSVVITPQADSIPAGPVQTDEEFNAGIKDEPQPAAPAVPDPRAAIVALLAAYDEMAAQVAAKDALLAAKDAEAETLRAKAEKWDKVKGLLDS